MIVYGDAKHSFSFVLPDNIVVKPLHDFRRSGKLNRIRLSDFLLFGNHVRAKLDTFVADIDAVRPRNKLLYLGLGFVAKRTSGF